MVQSSELYYMDRHIKYGMPNKESGIEKSNEISVSLVLNRQIQTCVSITKVAFRFTNATSRITIQLSDYN